MFSFRFARNFPNLVQPDFEDAYEIITITYSGLYTLWSNDTNKEAKQTLFINYLVAWYLANTRPEEVQGIVHDGGKAVSHKDIGGTALSYSSMNVQNGLEQFTTNIFGLEALRMLQGCPERFKIYG